VSIALIRTYTIVLWITGIVAGINVSNFVLFCLSSQPTRPLSFVSSLITILSMATIYGIYYELIENRYTSMKEIFSKYAFDYLLLNILMAVPFGSILLLIVYINPELLGLELQNTISIFFKVLFIYVTPIFYVQNKIGASLIDGVKYLFSNIQASIPILAAVIIFNVLHILAKTKMFWLFDVNRFFFVLFQYAVLVTSFLFDYGLFIILILIITNKYEDLVGSDLIRMS